jgi:hypothetical protein
LRPLLLDVACKGEVRGRYFFFAAFFFVAFFLAAFFFAIVVLLTESRGSRRGYRAQSGDHHYLDSFPTRQP